MKEQLSKREYFAALAMQGLISKDWPHDEIAWEAYSAGWNNKAEEKEND